jgi:esterase/lipase superfamily enzyme
MPTPVGFAGTGGDPFARTPAHARTDEVKLYVASNRGVRANAPPDEYFTTERSEQLRLGTMGVAIAGDGMPWPELEGVSRTWPREDGPEVSLRSIDDFGPVWQGIPGLATSAKSDAAVIARFAESVKADLAASTSKQLFVFVHGFNRDRALAPFRPAAFLGDPPTHGVQQLEVLHRPGQVPIRLHLVGDLAAKQSLGVQVAGHQLQVQL